MPIFVNLLAVVFLLVSSAAFAEPPAAETNATAATEKKQYYIVEVILFRNLNDAGMKDEYWSRPEDQGLNTRPGLTNNDSPALAEYNLSRRRLLPLRNGIAALSPEHYKLADSAAHLRYSPNYQVLAHFGWTQRSLSRGRALPIKISSENMTDSMLPSGELKLYVSRFLHLQVDLASSQCKPVQEPVPEQALTTETSRENDNSMDQKLAQGITPEDTLAQNAGHCVNNVYHFKQNRKMRSKELHYLDNPVYGLLVYVTPFTVGGSEPETSVQ